MIASISANVNLFIHKLFNCARIFFRLIEWELRLAIRIGDCLEIFCDYVLLEGLRDYLVTRHQDSNKCL